MSSPNQSSSSAGIPDKVFQKINKRYDARIAEIPGEVLSWHDFSDSKQGEINRARMMRLLNNEQEVRTSVILKEINGNSCEHLKVNNIHIGGGGPNYEFYHPLSKMTWAGHDLEDVRCDAAVDLAIFKSKEEIDKHRAFYKHSEHWNTCKQVVTMIVNNLPASLHVIAKAYKHKYTADQCELLKTVIPSMVSSSEGWQNVLITEFPGHAQLFKQGSNSAQLSMEANSRIRYVLLQILYQTPVMLKAAQRNYEAELEEYKSPDKLLDRKIELHGRVSSLLEKCRTHDVPRSVTDALINDKNERRLTVMLDDIDDSQTREDIEAVASRLAPIEEAMTLIACSKEGQ